MKYCLQQKRKISANKSRKLILMMAKHSNHTYYRESHYFRAGVGKISDDDVKNFILQQGSDFERLVNKCRDYHNNVPFFENLVGGVWKVDPKATISLTDETIKGPGEYSTLNYWSLYEEAAKALKKAIAEVSFGEFRTALAKGIASIEGYISHRAAIWNKKNPHDCLLDTKVKKVSFDDKIGKWLPKMTGGEKLKKETNWQHYKKLRGIRDKLTMHPHGSSYTFSYVDLTDRINEFRTGIAGLLIDLHLLFNEKIPATIIRGYFSPDVELNRTDCAFESIGCIIVF